MTGTPLTRLRDATARQAEEPARAEKQIGDSLAVVVRAAVIAIPRIVRIIIRRVVSIIAGLGRANPIIDVVDIGAAAKQKCKSHGTDQRRDRYNVPTLFPFSYHAFGALI